MSRAFDENGYLPFSYEGTASKKNLVMQFEGKAIGKFNIPDDALHALCVMLNDTCRSYPPSLVEFKKDLFNKTLKKKK